MPHTSTSADSYAQPNQNDVDAVLRFNESEINRAELSPVAVYETRQSTLGILIDLLPPGPLLEETLSAESAFLYLNPVETIDPEAWLRAFRTLIYISRPLDPSRKETTPDKLKGQLRQPSPEAPLIRKLFQARRADPVIDAYESFESTFVPRFSLVGDPLQF